MNRKNRVCSAALSAVLTLTLVTAPAQALDTAGAERTEGGYAVMQAVSGLSIGEIDSSGIIYNGKAQTPTPKITVGGTELVAGTDFRMEYSNNVHAGTGIAYILGMGKYAGYVGSCEFTIHPAQLVVKVDDVQDVKDPASYTYTILQGTLASGDSLGQPQYSVKDNGNSTKTVSATFQDNADYEITVLPGTLTIVQTLGTVVISGPSNVFYNGSAQTPKPTVQDASTGKTLTEGRDYNLVYRNNVNAGKASVTINGIGIREKMLAIICKSSISVAVQARCTRTESKPINPCILLWKESGIISMDFRCCNSNSFLSVSASGGKSLMLHMTISRPSFTVSMICGFGAVFAAIRSSSAN